MIDFFESKRGRDLLRLELLRESKILEEDEEKLNNISVALSKKDRRFLFSKSSRHLERVVLSELPIILESLILLVESGLGILPAMHKLLENSGQETNFHDARYYLRKVHQLSAHGLPFAESLERVAEECPHPALRHFFLHLDIGANVGGKLGNSLRSLAQHCHQEWRLSVEARVRRLENLVVFPVFGSVIGLILLTASVPLIPLLELRDKLDQSQSAQSASSQKLQESLP